MHSQGEQKKMFKCEKADVSVCIIYVKTDKILDKTAKNRREVTIVKMHETDERKMERSLYQ